MKIAFGTDAVAGAHGRNAEEFIYRVKEGGEKPMDAIVSATSVSAESLGLGNEIENDCAWISGGFRCCRWRSNHRHYCGASRAVHHEGWEDLQEPRTVSSGGFP